MTRFERFLKEQRDVLNKAMRSQRGRMANTPLTLESSDPVVQQVMDDTFIESRMLLTSFGFMDHELREELGEFYEVGVIYTAMAAYEAEREWGGFGSPSNNDIAIPALTQVLFGVNTIQARSIGTCLLEAVGVGALYDWAVNKALASRRALIRAVGRFLGRSLGFVGVALAVADFIWCMNRE